MARGALAALVTLVTLDNPELITGPHGGNILFKCLPYQLSLVLSVPTVVATEQGK